MIVFLHGVPETAAIWRKVRAAIDRESVALELPGFGCPRLDSIRTKDDYVAWVLEQLADVKGPIDLVGHDWGAGLTYRIATAYGDRIRSWAADIGNIAHPDYQWHDFAKIWQSAEGEAYFETQLATPVEERAGLYELLGLLPEDALEMAAAGDAQMGESILGLYRSALPNPYAGWGPWAHTAAPGLVLNPSDDMFGDAAMAEEVAVSLGARFEPIAGAGHFWPYQAPEAGAAILKSFWSSLDE